MQLRIILFLFLTVFSTILVAQTDSTKTEKTKKGWTFGLIPVVAFDSDLGFKYGGLVNFYNYGDGSTYPKYLQSIFCEISMTTKGSGTNRLFFDSEHLFPGKKIRVTSDLSYLTEQAMDFHGFNGYQSNYNPGFEDMDDTSYRTRVYYRHARNMFRFTTDFQSKISSSKFRWLAGFGYFNYKISTVDIADLNKGQDDEDKLPDSTNTLFDEYVKYGLINSKEANGGHLAVLKGGIIFDTRDIEANPNKGIWTEFIVYGAPGFMDNYENSFLGFSFTHRQYITLFPKRLTFAYRLGYKDKIAGSVPFYFDPYILNSYSNNVLPEGLGGAKNLRGILRNRIVGDGFAYGNFELRYKAIKTVLFKQNIYIAFNGFADCGIVTSEYDIDKTKIPANLQSEYFYLAKDELHWSAGMGIHIALNENFVLSVNHGRALKIQDGTAGTYITMNWIF